jgi:hypothetical protein
MVGVMTLRPLAAAGLVAALFALGACGGGAKPNGASSPASSAPGANVDPNANGTFTGPINQAKRVAGQQSQQSAQENQQTSSNP